ncbi:MAG: thymidine phosphorylase [Hyphomicrobiales bacterium]|nr:thymidine phosphorylase [Hyphomicrobiales bacterium]
MLAQEFIRAKRDGGVLACDDIAAFIAALTDGSLSEGQAAAFAMAVFFRGLARDETVALTRAMAQSGDMMDWADLDLPGPVLDKHSTGGVGDNVSLMLAPLVAACGGYVPMISGRGLGHTGGTLDKLDTIPGYVSRPDGALFRRVVREAGAAIIGQTRRLAPADQRLYAIRDVTATVESIPLITASILSKKLAAGLQGLVMDVKSGNGAFMPTLERAEALAGSIVDVAKACGLPTAALITNMDAPLAPVAGNAIEVAQAVAWLRGEREDARLREVVMALGVRMLRLGGLAASDGEAAAKLATALHSGAAAERFARMVAALGGPGDFIEHCDKYLPAAPVHLEVTAQKGGYVEAIATRALGLVVVELGGGRRRVEDIIDPAVGLSDLALPGQFIARGAPLAVVHARDQASGAAAVAGVLQAYRLSDKAAAAPPLILASRD